MKKEIEPKDTTRAAAYAGRFLENLQSEINNLGIQVGSLYGNRLADG